MRPKPLLLVLCLLSLAGTPLAGLAQSDGQRELLERAYDTKSYVLLEQFFDNWQKEYTDNEAEAPDKWVAEAHKVFAAMLRPDISSEIPMFNYSIQDSVLVLQCMLDKIGFAEGNLDAFKNGNLDSTIYVIVDSAVDFRPNPHLDNQITVYLTEGYRNLVEDFISNFMLPSLPLDDTYEDFEKTEADSAWTLTGDEEESYDDLSAYLSERWERQRFLMKDASSLFCNHILGPSIHPSFAINEMVFDRSFRYAVVRYRQDSEKRGGTIVLKKVKNKWTFDHLYDWWVSS